MPAPKLFCQGSILRHNRNDDSLLIVFEKSVTVSNVSIPYPAIIWSFLKDWNFKFISVLTCAFCFLSMSFKLG